MTATEKDIQNTLKQAKSVTSVIASQILSVAITATCKTDDEEQVREEIYKLEAEVMEKHPSTKFDFHLKIINS